MATLFRRLFAALLALVFVSSAAVNEASAHNTLVSSSPSSGAVLETSPTEWILTFDKTVPLTSASGEVVRSDGVRVTLQQPIHGASDNIIVFTLPPNLTNSTTARWRLVGTDGHVISGRVTFSIGTDTSSPATPSTAAPVDIESDGEVNLLPQPHVPHFVSSTILRFFFSSVCCFLTSFSCSAKQHHTSAHALQVFQDKALASRHSFNVSS